MINDKTLHRFLKRYDVRRAAKAIKVLRLLYPDCQIILVRGVGEILILCPSEDRLYEVWGGQPFYAKWMDIDRLIFIHSTTKVELPIEEISTDIYQYFSSRQM